MKMWSGKGRRCMVHGAVVKEVRECYATASGAVRV